MAIQWKHGCQEDNNNPSVVRGGRGKGRVGEGVGETTHLICSLNFEMCLLSFACFYH